MASLWVLVLLAAQAEMPGLILEARDGERRVVEVAPAPHFSLRAEQSIHPRLRPGFRAEWNGFLKIVRGGRYTLSGDAKVSIGGREAGGRAVELEPGLHPIRIEVAREAGRPARLQLLWESDFFGREPVPPSAFVRRASPPEEETLAERGRERAAELGCANCHRAALPSRRGPDLAAVGSRTNARWLAHWLENPRAFRAQAAMPKLLDAAEAADVAAFLAGLRGPAEPPRAAPSDPGRLERGRELFGKVGCAQCHGAALEGMGSKYEVGVLARFLLDPLAVDPSGRMPSLLLAEDEASLLAEHLVQSRNPAFEAPVREGDPARGRALVGARRCAACHAIPGIEAPPAPELAKLDPSRGCLDDDPRTPRYALEAAERKALQAFVASFAREPDRSDAPAHAFRHAVRAFRCTACHALDDSTPQGLEAYPPALTDAGQKLRPAWIEAVLAKKKRIRPWMDVRMPHFGEANVKALIEGFPAAAGEADPEPRRAPSPAQVREGIRLIGRDPGGLSCITCHDFKGNVSLGTRGPDMVEMADRLRQDWFGRWMRDPIRLQPGTSMPNFFAATTPEEREAKIDLLWVCLAAGPDLPLPAGLEAAHTSLVVVRDAPVVFRTFLPDASPAAIAVGLPGGVSYCFEGDTCRLRYAWSGDFLDMSPSWTGRGGAPAVLKGRKFYTAPDPFPLRLGDRPATPRFRGYAMKEGHPEFLYELDGAEVRQRIAALPEGAGLEASFTVAEPKGPVSFFLGKPSGARLTPSAGEVKGEWLVLPAAKTVSFTLKIEKEKK